MRKPWGLCVNAPFIGVIAVDIVVMTVSDLILVNHSGAVIAGGKPGRRLVNLAGFEVCVSITMLIIS